MNAAGVARGRLRLARHALFGRGRSPGGRARHPLLAVALSLGLGSILLGGMRALFAWVARNGAGPADAAGLLGPLLAAGMVGLLVFDAQEAIGVLLLDSDLELLRRAPLRARELFALKLGDALARTSTVVVVFLLPALTAYAAVFHLPAWGWALVPLALAALWAVPLGLAVALTLALVSRLPPRRARELLALLSTLALLLVWFGNALLLPRLAASDAPVPALVERLLHAPRHPLALLPSTWAARALAAAASGDAAAAARAALPLLLAAALALALAAGSASRWLEEAQARAGAPRGRRRVAPPAARDPLAAAERGPHGAWSAILRRDACLFFRDWSVLADVLASAALWTVLPLVGLSIQAPPSPLLARIMLLMLALALGHEVAARSLPFEREGGAWRQLAPVTAARWAAAKLSGAALISLPLLLVASGTLALALRLDGREWLLILATVVPALALALTLGLLNGASFGNPRWTDPRAMLGLSGRLVALLLLAAQLALWLAYSLAAPALHRALPPGVAFLLPTALAGTAATIPWRATVRRLERTEWPG